MAVTAAIVGGTVLAGALANKQKKPKAGFTDDSFYDKDIQRFLPTALRAGAIDPVLNKGFAGIADFINRPGQLGANISESIAPRLAVESERIARDFAGQREQVAGGLARGNAPVSIKGALAAALGTQEFAQQGQARRSAMMESEQLRRADVGQVYDILGAIQGQVNPRLGVAGPLQGQANQIGQQNAAANQAAIASLLGSMGNINWGGGGAGAQSSASGQYGAKFTNFTGKA